MPTKHDPDDFFMANPEMYDLIVPWLEEYSQLTTFKDINWGLALFLPFCREILVCRGEE